VRLTGGYKHSSHLTGVTDRHTDERTDERNSISCISVALIVHKMRRAVKATVSRLAGTGLDCAASVITRLHSVAKQRLSSRVRSRCNNHIRDFAVRENMR